MIGTTVIFCKGGGRYRKHWWIDLRIIKLWYQMYRYFSTDLHITALDTAVQCLFKPFKTDAENFKSKLHYSLVSIYGYILSWTCHSLMSCAVACHIEKASYIVQKWYWILWLTCAPKIETPASVFLFLPHPSAFKWINECKWDGQQQFPSI